MRPLRDLGFLVLVSASVAVAGCGSGAGVPGSWPVRSAAGSKSAGHMARSCPRSATVVLGFDGSRAAFDAVRRGRLKATILQDPLEQGKKAVDPMVAHLRGHSLDPEIITPLRLIWPMLINSSRPTESNSSQRPVASGCTSRAKVTRRRDRARSPALFY